MSADIQNQGFQIGVICMRCSSRGVVLHEAWTGAPNDDNSKNRGEQMTGNQQGTQYGSSLFTRVDGADLYLMSDSLSHASSDRRPFSCRLPSALETKSARS